ncbi:MAG: beta-lactamase family protein [Gemmatimonadetes bacterium]|nr:beta-lactamase family protein [Gemmatimonadota bacterium]
MRYCHLTPLIANRAHGYASRKEGGFRNADYQEMSTPYAAGAICSTASDLVKWTMALESGKVVRPATYREMTTPRALTDGTKQPYAFGLGVSDLAGHRIVSHNGGIDGFRSQLASYPNDSLIIAVLVNGDSDLPDRFEKTIARWALGVPEPVVKDLAVPAELIARVTGATQESGTGSHRREGGEAVRRTRGDAPAPLSGERRLHHGRQRRGRDPVRPGDGARRDVDGEGVGGGAGVQARALSRRSRIGCPSFSCRARRCVTDAAPAAPGHRCIVMSGQSCGALRGTAMPHAPRGSRRRCADFAGSSLLDRLRRRWRVLPPVGDELLDALLQHRQRDRA